MAWVAVGVMLLVPVGVGPSATHLPAAAGVTCLVGAGTTGDPFLVGNADDLAKVGSGTDGCTDGASYLQTADIALAAPAAGDSSNVPTASDQATFTGVFDGGGFAIDGLVVARAGESGVGFFTGAFGATIRDVHITGGSITGGVSTGGLIGAAVDSMVSGSSFSGTVTSDGTGVGGLIGLAIDSTVLRSFSQGTVTGETSVGGLIGYAERTDVRTSFSTADVFGTGDRVGGLIGHFRGRSGVSAAGRHLTDSFARGDVTRSSTGPAVGGVIGEVSDATIARVFATGAVSQGCCGVVGLVTGSTGSTTIDDSFWDTELNPVNLVGPGRWKTTIELTSRATFADTATVGLTTAWPIVAGWAPYEDVTTVWGICWGVNDGYPFLLWQFDTDPCPVPSLVNVSTSTPYKSPVDITIEDLPAGTYTVYYLNLLIDPDASGQSLLESLENPLYDPFGYQDLTYWGYGLFAGQSPADGRLALTVPDWFSIGGELNVVPGIVVVLRTGIDPRLLAAGDFSAVVALSAQMFPGAVGNGAPVYTIEGPGFVDGAFVAGQAIEVTATGFPEGTDELTAYAWIPTVPSTGDVRLDFWRDFLNECADGGEVACPFGSEPYGFDSFVDGGPGPSVPGSLEGVVARGIAPSAGMSIVVYHRGVLNDTSLDGNERFFFGYDAFRLADFVATLGGDAVESPASSAALTPSVSCVPLTPTVDVTVTCTVTGGDAGIDILWRAAYNPVIAEAGVTLDASGSGEFSFVVPAAAVGEEVTVELVGWTAPVSMGVSGGPVPTSVPSGGGPVPVWPLGLFALAGVLVFRRGSRSGRSALRAG